MVSGGSELRGLARRSSVADGDVLPAHAKPANPTSATAGEGGGFTKSDSASGKPMTVMRQPRLPLAPIERAAPDAQRKIVEFLTLRDAIRLMMTSTGLHHLIQADPWFRQDDLLRSLEALGLNELVDSMQSLEAEIFRLELKSSQPALPLQHLPNSNRRVRPCTFVAGALPEAAVLGILFADYCCNMLLARSATKATQADERATQADVRGKEAQMARVATRLRAFEPQIERVVIHYVEEHLERPRLGHDLAAATTVNVESASAEVAAVPEDIRSKLNKAIKDGNVALARLVVRQYLRLPASLMSSAAKLDRLVLQPGGPLEYFGVHRCGFLNEEKMQYESLMACTDEIVSSGIFMPSDEVKLCAKLAEICRGVMRTNNPAVAASILLGVHESSAIPQLKQACLAAIGDTWHSGLDGFVDSVSKDLVRYKRGAPEWVNSVMTRLLTVKRALPALGDGTRVRQSVT